MIALMAPPGGKLERLPDQMYSEGHARCWDGDEIVALPGTTFAVDRFDPRNLPRSGEGSFGFRVFARDEDLRRVLPPILVAGHAVRLLNLIASVWVWSVWKGGKP